jgi:hypothetical protein
MRHVKLICLVALIGIAGACDDDEGDGDEYEAVLTGGAERPAVTTTATGNFELQDDGASMTYTLTVNNITGVTAAHIHAIPRSGAAPADTVGGIVVNLNPTLTVTSGVLAQATFTAANIVGLAGAAPISLDSLRTLMNAGRTYVNVHTAANPGGHIRGTITRD